MIFILVVGLFMWAVGMLEGSPSMLIGSLGAFSALTALSYCYGEARRE